MTASVPSTFSAVLRAELTRRCARNPSYSLRAFARSLAMDHATLSQLLRGRRPMTAELVQQLGERLGLAAADIDAFRRDLEAVRTGPPAHSPALDAAAIVAEPLHHQLLALTRADEFRSDARFLAQVLDTTPDAINVVMQRLLRFGLLSLGPGGEWRDVSGIGERDPEEFERAVWDHAARRVSASSATAPATSVSGAPLAGPVKQFQIFARDPDGTARFYALLFGWTVEAENRLAYRTLSTGQDGLPGGIWPAPSGATPLVQLMMQTADVEACVERARSLGAKVVVPPQTLPDGDGLAVLVDPEGRPFGVFSRGPGR